MFDTKLATTSLVLLTSVLAVADECSYRNRNKPDKNAVFLGIDFGTRYTHAATVKDGQLEVVAESFPSYVAFTGNQDVLVGETAKEQQSINSQNTIYGVKRLLGRSFNDTTLREDIKRLPFTVVEKEYKPYIQVKIGSDVQLYEPEEIAALTLKSIKQSVESKHGPNLTRLVLTVPAHFNDAQRTATKKAGVLAGFDVYSILNEPSAAMLMKVREDNEKEEFLLVLSFGASMCEANVISFELGISETIVTKRDTQLGGDDFDSRIIDYIIENYEKEENIKVNRADLDLEKLKLQAEQAKHRLSEVNQTIIKVESFYKGKNLSETLTKDRFEMMNKDYFRSVIKLMEETIIEAVKYMQVDSEQKIEIKEIILAGGSSSIPKLQRMVKDHFSNQVLTTSTKPELLVAHGAAKTASQTVNEFLLCDCWLSLSLGIETVGGVMAKILPRSSWTPVTKTRVFSTAVDNQAGVMIRVFEGERLMTKDNYKLAEFKLNGITPAPRGVTQIEVTFIFDVNHNLQVIAKDTASGESSNITIQQKGFSDEMLETIICDYEANMAEDEKLKEQLPVRDELENGDVTNQLINYEEIKLLKSDDSRAGKIENVFDQSNAHVSDKSETTFKNRVKSEDTEVKLEESNLNNNHKLVSEKKINVHTKTKKLEKREL